MRIALLSHWYDPEGGAAAGPGTVARLLRDRGHEVEVLTGYPQYPLGKVFAGYRMRPYMREIMDGVTVHRAPIYPSHDTHSARRAANYLSYAVTAAVIAPRALRNVDAALVYSTPATAAMPAMALRRMRGVPYALWVQDLWPDTVTSSGLLGANRQGSVEKVLHRFCDTSYRHASAVAAIAPGMLRKIENRGVPRSKLRLIPNWADESSFRPSHAGEAVRQEVGPLRPFSVMYAGNFGELQSLDTVIAAAERLRNHEQIGFVLVGGGVQEAELRASVRRRQLHNVTFVPRQPFDRMSEVLSLADVQLVTLRDVPLLRATIPSKLQANLAVGKPIIGSVAGDAARIIEEAQAGRAVRPQDPAALAEAVLQMHSLQEAERRRMGESARAYYLANFAQTVVGEKLEELMAAVVNGQVRE